MAEALVGACGRLCIPANKTRKLLGVGERQLKGLLTARTPMFKGPDLVARGYEEFVVNGVRWLALPRRLSEAIPPGKCENAMGGAPRPIMEDPPLGAVALYPYQLACVDLLETVAFTPAKVAAGAALGYLNLSAGRGKTLVGVELARRVGGRCAVVAPRQQICEQWRQTFEDHVPGVAVVIAGDVPPARRSEVLGAAGVVLMSPSLALRENCWEQYALVIIDEAHGMCSAKWRQVLERQTAARVLGLSASTESRTDQMDPVAKWHLGEPLLARDIPGYAAMDVTFYGRMRLVEVADPVLAKSLRGLGHAEAQQELHLCTRWVEGVVGEVAALLELDKTTDLREGRPPMRATSGHNVILFTEHREAVAVYTEALLARLGGGVVALGCEPGEEPEVACMMGGTASKEASRILREARVVVTTFSYSAVGVSLDRFTAAVLATTRKSQLYQILSRVLRVNSDTAVRRDYVCWIGPRANWKAHGKALAACAAGLGFPVVVEKRRIAPAIETRHT